MPDTYTGRGDNVSPVLSWSDPPPGTMSFALVMDDPDAPMGTFTHWVLYNVPATLRDLPWALPAREVLDNAGRQLRNDAGRLGYPGPLPPPGKLHHYRFQLHALDRMLDPFEDKRQLLETMKCHVLGQALLTGLYQR